QPSGRCAERYRRVIREYIYPTSSTFYPQFVERVGLRHVDMSEGQVDPHLPGLLGKIGCIRHPVAGEDDLGSGSFDLLEVRGKIGQEEFMVILTDNLRIGIVLSQASFKAIGEIMAERIILTKNVEFLILFLDLTVVVGQAAGNLVSGRACVE